MTPAKLLALGEKRLDDVELRERLLVQIAHMYANFNRDPGDETKGRAPAPEIPISVFQLKRRQRGQSLAAKDAEDRPGGAHNLRGAVADKGEWEAFTAGKKAQRERKSTKRKV